jgi:hypothetical protein
MAAVIAVCRDAGTRTATIDLANSHSAGDSHDSSVACIPTSDPAKGPACRAAIVGSPRLRLLPIEDWQTSFCMSFVHMNLVAGCGSDVPTDARACRDRASHATTSTFLSISYRRTTWDVAALTCGICSDDFQTSKLLVDNHPDHPERVSPTTPDQMCR